MSFDFRLTAVGEALLQQARADGTAVTVTSAKLGQGQYTPDGSETDIRTPFNPPKEFAPLRGVFSNGILKFDFQDTSMEAYNVGEVGLFAGATPLAIASRPSAAGYLYAKAAGAVGGFAYEEDLSETDMPTINFSGTGYPVVLADENTYGLVRKAESGTADDDDERYMTKALVLAEIADIDLPTGDRSNIVHVEPAQVAQAGSAITLTPAGVTAVDVGDAFRFSVKAATLATMTIQAGSDVARNLVMRGGHQVGVSPALAAGDEIVVVRVGLSFVLVALALGSAALAHLGTGQGQVPVLGAGGKLAGDVFPTDRPPIKVGTATVAAAITAGTVANGDIYFQEEA